MRIYGPQNERPFLIQWHKICNSFCISIGLMVLEEGEMNAIISFLSGVLIIIAATQSTASLFVSRVGPFIGLAMIISAVIATIANSARRSFERIINDE